jgi:hypothetical protein
MVVALMVAGAEAWQEVDGAMKRIGLTGTKKEVRRAT